MTTITSTISSPISKAIAINGSPKGKYSTTYSMLSEICAGLNEGGVTTEIINLSELKIGHCRGCFTCWFATPGKCAIKDDMSSILGKVVENDLIIYGTPLYCFTMTGLLKNFLDRGIPLLEPTLVDSESMPNLTAHPKRYVKPTKMLLVANCGFPEATHFDALSATFKKIALVDSAEYVDEIFCPMGPLLSVMPMHEMLAPYFAALRMSGKEIATAGKIDIETRKKLRADLLPGGADAYRELINKRFHEKLHGKNAEK